MDLSEAVEGEAARLGSPEDEEKPESALVTLAFFILLCWMEKFLLES